MNASVAPAIAVAAARARRELVSHFREAGAVSPGTAVAYEPRRRLGSRYADSLLRHGALIDAGGGAYYLNEAKLASHTSRRRTKVLGAAAIAALVVAFIGLA